ncbi:MAG: CPBP family intramembrane metalloprotease [Clostridiales bacterium]|nr:CPBP family intramembrane metalloprotease [Clostridiales bacterium]
MSDLINKITRPCRKASDFFILAALLSLVLVIIGEIIAIAVFNGLDVDARLIKWSGSDSVGTFLGMYLYTFGVWIAFLLMAGIFKGNRPMLKAIAPNKRLNNLGGILLGIGLGFGTNGFCVLMSWLTGDIKLSYNGLNWKLLIAFLICVFIQSSSEEVADRVYLYQKLRRRYRSPLVAILVNSVIFMAMHMGNPGFTMIAGSQIFLVAIIFSLFVYYYDGVWVAFWFHTAWNYTQNIIFGLPNSGIVSEYSIFRLEAASARNGLFYNVDFGVEGSIGSSLVLLLVIAVMVFINRNKHERKDYWAEAERQAAGQQAVYSQAKHAK